MADHNTLDPALVHARYGEPPGVAAPDPAYLDAVWADHDLLRAEFDQIIAANFPDVAGSGRRTHPVVTVGTRTPPRPTRRTRSGLPHPPGQDRIDATLRQRARQRSPPAPRSGAGTHPICPDPGSPSQGCPGRAPGRR